MLAQAECEKALGTWIEQFTGEHDDEKGGGKYIRSESGVFANVQAILNRKRLPHHRTEAERAVDISAPPKPRARTRGAAARKRPATEIKEATVVKETQTNTARKSRPTRSKENFATPATKTKMAAPTMPSKAAPVPPAPKAAVAGTKPTEMPAFLATATVAPAPSIAPSIAPPTIAIPLPSVAEIAQANVAPDPGATGGGNETERMAALLATLQAKPLATLQQAPQMQQFQHYQQMQQFQQFQQMQLCSVSAHVFLLRTNRL